jgi:GNAT superfamily N-acetyltransferase
MSTDTNIAITILDPRPATPADAEEIVAMIRELAVFEKLEHMVAITPELLRSQLFGARPAAEAVIVEAVSEARREPIAFALYFHNFSTFLGRPGLYLEDLYVRSAWRGRGVGKALLRHLGALAVARGCGRFEWSVLDWNTRAIDVYRSIGAELMDDWRICRVSGEALSRLAGDRG